MKAKYRFRNSVTKELHLQLLADTDSEWKNEWRIRKVAVRNLELFGADSMPPTDRQIGTKLRNGTLLPLTLSVCAAMSAFTGFAESIKCGFRASRFFRRGFCLYRRD
jgi:hypothetical protein